MRECTNQRCISRGRCRVFNSLNEPEAQDLLIKRPQHDGEHDPDHGADKHLGNRVADVLFNRGEAFARLRRQGIHDTPKRRAEPPKEDAETQGIVENKDKKRHGNGKGDRLESLFETHDGREGGRKSRVRGRHAAVARTLVQPLRLILPPIAREEGLQRLGKETRGNGNQKRWDRHDPLVYHDAPPHDPGGTSRNHGGGNPPLVGDGEGEGGAVTVNGADHPQLLLSLNSVIAFGASAQTPRICNPAVATQVRVSV